MKIVAIQTESVNLTEEQFFNLCANNRELRIERDKHQNIIIMSPTGAETGNLNAEISADLIIWNRKNKLGYCFDSNSGFTLPNNAMRSPDASWIAKEKWENIPKKDRKRFAHICPDFVIELLSETDTLIQQNEKMDEWIENGCSLGWLIDPVNRTSYIYKPNTEPIKHSFTETLSGETILPGFELKLAEIIL